MLINHLKKKVWKCFNEKGATSFLSLGSCPLHTTHNGFTQGFKSFECYVDQLACDLYFFLKYSSARRDDYKFVEEITEVTGQFMLRRCQTRWVSIDKVLLRIIEQFDNLYEYFVNTVPKQANFKREMANTE